MLAVRGIVIHKQTRRNNRNDTDIPGMAALVIPTNVHETSLGAHLGELEV